MEERKQFEKANRLRKRLEKNLGGGVDWLSRLRLYLEKNYSEVLENKDGFPTDFVYEKEDEFIKTTSTL